MDAIVISAARGPEVFESPRAGAPVLTKLFLAELANIHAHGFALGDGAVKNARTQRNALAR